MNKFINKPKNIQFDAKSRYEVFGLKENPFPAHPVINISASDNRMNGDIYEQAIREKEYNLLAKCFLKKSQNDINHNRLGYIIDNSYVGRGNGKSTFAVNAVKKINANFCLDISNGENKCFGIYIYPEAGGQVKTFSKFIDKIFDGFLISNIIDMCLTSLKLEAITKLHKDFNLDILEESTIVNNLRNRSWFEKNKIDLCKVNNYIQKNELLQTLPNDLFPRSSILFQTMYTQELFESYYFSLKKIEDKLDFMFNHLISLAQASGFNGGYIFIDDFERIPDFQSSRQKKDFASQLRTYIFDGNTKNARMGFLNFILVLHAGVHRLIQESWDESGLAQRAPLNPEASICEHIIYFEKLDSKAVELLILKYLNTFRLEVSDGSDLTPFNKEALELIGQKSQFNATKILKNVNLLLENAIDSKVTNINKLFVENFFNKDDRIFTNSGIDLIKEAEKKI